MQKALADKEDFETEMKAHIDATSLNMDHAYVVKGHPGKIQNS